MTHPAGRQLADGCRCTCSTSRAPTTRPRTRSSRPAAPTRPTSCSTSTPTACPTGWSWTPPASARSNSAQSGAMGEAWSDWYAFDCWSTRAVAKDTARAGEIRVGDYVGAGNDLIRTQPLDCPVGSDVAEVPGPPNAGPGGYTYGDFGHISRRGAEVHADGEIWGETLWDLRTALGSKLDRVAGDPRRWSCRRPSRPMLDMRNSILQADKVRRQRRPHLKASGSVRAPVAWATSPARPTAADTAPVEDFQVPPTGHAERQPGRRRHRDRHHHPVAGRDGHLRRPRLRLRRRPGGRHGRAGQYTDHRVLPGPVPGRRRRRGRATCRRSRRCPCTGPEHGRTGRPCATGRAPVAAPQVTETNGDEYTRLRLRRRAALIDMSQGVGWSRGPAGHRRRTSTPSSSCRPRST